MPIGRCRDDVKVVVRADDLAPLPMRMGHGRAGVDRAPIGRLQVARGGGDDCRDDRIPLATGLPRDGNEVVHSED